MGLRFFNSLSKKVEDFIPLQEGKVGYYACGPTVYNYAHIGNFRAYVFNDLLYKYLLFRGYDVTYVMNITDVDDKTIRDSRKAGRTLKEFTDFYLDAFYQDLETLRVLRPPRILRATDEIEGMVELITKLLETGHAYKAENGDIYFKISEFSDYGKMVNLDTSQLKANAAGRLGNADEYQKDDANDFALWKAYNADIDGDVYWEAPIGKGRPGWHTECAVMSVKVLGQPFDIHAGGIDLMFPHHTNEIAQAECAHGKKFVNYWLHNEHLLVDGKKMSKSLGNFYTLRDLMDQDLNPLAIRYELLKTHYRQQLDFRIDHMRQNQDVLNKFSDFLERLEDASAGSPWKPLDTHLKRLESGFVSAMDDDLNIAGALAAIFEFMNQVNKELESLSAEDADRIVAFLKHLDSVLGFIFPNSHEVSDAEIERLIHERNEARENKNYARSDEIRDELLSRGIVLKDTPQGVKWRKA